MIKTESDYDPRVVSAVGAKGLMQLMPAAQGDMGVTDPFHPRQGILGGTRLLRILANKFDGDVVLTIAAYHAGAGAVSKYGNQVPPYTRTRQYLRVVLDRYQAEKARAGGGHACAVASRSPSPSLSRRRWAAPSARPAPRTAAATCGCRCATASAASWCRRACCCGRATSRCASASSTTTAASGRSRACARSAPACSRAGTA